MGVGHLFSSFSGKNQFSVKPFPDFENKRKNILNKTENFSIKYLKDFAIRLSEGINLNKVKYEEAEKNKF